MSTVDAILHLNILNWYDAQSILLWIVSTKVSIWIKKQSLNNHSNEQANDQVNDHVNDRCRFVDATVVVAVLDASVIQGSASKHNLCINRPKIKYEFTTVDYIH